MRKPAVVVVLVACCVLAFANALGQSDLLPPACSSASPTACQDAGGTLVGSECRITTVLTLPCPFTLTLPAGQDLRITASGGIQCTDVGAPGNSAQPITVNVCGGNMVMDAGSKMLAENNNDGGAGGNITITVSGDMTLCADGSPGAPCLATPPLTGGARISSSRTSGTGATPAGNISIAVGNYPSAPPSGTFAMGPGTLIAADSTGSGGSIVITAGEAATINGTVESVSTLSGTGAIQAPGGGPITIIAGCTTVVTSTGTVISKGNDPGADLVHIEGCSVAINGLVASTGAAHAVPNSPTNHCYYQIAGVPNSGNLPQLPRPDKPSNSTACVEIWGDTVSISSTAGNMGEINADTATSGGTQGRGWIDVYGRQTVSIEDGAGNDHTISLPGGGSFLSLFAIHANQYLTNGNGGIATVASTASDILGTGNVIQVDNSNGGGNGGEVYIEANGNLSLPTASLFARGDFAASGGFGEGGNLGIIGSPNRPIRSYTGTLSWTSGVGDVRPTGTDVSNALARGQIILQDCLGPAGVITLGTTFPANGTATTPTILADGCDGLQPVLPTYVVLPAANCSDLCSPNACEGVDCNDNNPCTNDFCDDPQTGHCAHTPVDVGTACGDPSDTMCDNPDTCDANGICQPNPASVTTPCVGTSNGGACDGTDSCDGAGNCVDGYQPATTICRPSTGQCDPAESCSGTTGSCPTDGFLPATTTCTGTSNGGPCDGADSCDGQGHCVDGYQPATTICRPSTGQCDPSESCSGTTGSCPTDGFLPATTTCTGTSNGGPCDGADSCDGQGHCVDGYQPATTICRPSTGQCDPSESCSGTTGSCPTDGFLPATTTCTGTSNGGPCDGADSCDGQGHCVDGYQPATTICRPSTGQCDPSESCSGTTGSCPTDGFLPATTTCTGTSNGGPCDGADSCDGQGHCVDGYQPATTICRPSTGQCDPSESCSGTTGSCPTDGFLPATTTCTGTSNGGPCDGADSCDGQGHCVDGYQPATTICRPSTGQCDPSESCSGTTGSCPTDGFLPATTTCTGTSNGGPCDGADSCDGQGHCVDGYQPATTICRPSTGQCDPSESCSGTTGSCPTDGFLPATTTCTGTSNGGPCDGADSCDGQGHCVDGYQPATTICRPSTGQCDPSESCSGTTGSCPTDGFLPATTTCTGTSNGGPCDGADSCDGQGHCVDGYQPATTICRPSTGQCDPSESCSGTTGSCPTDGFLPATTTCTGTSNGGPCDGADSCDGQGHCVDGFRSATTICRPSTGPCDVAESCSGTTGSCPTDGFQPATTTCTGTSNGGPCDGADSCDGQGHCVDGFRSATTICRPSTGPCDLAESCLGTTGACPADGFQPATTTCTGTSNGGPCDGADSCDGQGHCVDGFRSATTICRPSAGQCDLAESCAGTTGSCPPDGFVPATSICRPAAGPCDVAESCPGNGPNCPTDGFSETCCLLTLDKTCCTAPPRPTSSFDCDEAKPISSLTVIWNGAVQPIYVKAWNGSIGTGTPQTFGPINIGDPVTFTRTGTFPNDVVFQIYSNPAMTTPVGTGKSDFHLSCSDDDMDGSEDCGKVAGDAKGLVGYENTWIFEGMAGSGQVLDCHPEPSDDPTQACQQAPTSFSCDDAKPISSLTVSWNGSVQPVYVKAWNGSIGTGTPQTFGPINIGDPVTFTRTGTFPNDVFFQIYSNPAMTTPVGTGKSDFHLSCSDDDMDGSEDCGKVAGDAKGQVGYENTWIFEGMAGSGQVLDCHPEPNLPGDTCEIPPPVETRCEQRPKKLSLRYTGDDCSQSNNTQDPSKVICTDGQSAAACTTVRIDAFAGANFYRHVTDGTVSIGDVFVIDAAAVGRSDVDSDITFRMFDAVTGDLCQDVKFHTSCSQDLRLGDTFGGLEVVSFENNAQGVVQLGAQVAYFYTVTNTGPVPVSNVHVVDDQGVEVTCPQDTLAVGESMICTGSAFIVEDTVNTATATADSPPGPGSRSCQAVDSAHAVIPPPPPCSVDAESTIKLGKKNAEWKLTNIGGSAATINSVTIGWPAANGNLKKVKLNGNTIFDGSIPPTSTTINTWIGGQANRQIAAGATATLKFEFANNVAKIAGQYSITVNFAEGCSVIFEPISGSNFQCVKPLDSVSMIWDGTQPIRVKAWKGTVGSTLLADIDNIAAGQEVTVSGYAGSPNDVIWEIFAAGTSTKIGESQFHLSCSDSTMNGAEDCGSRQGNGKSNISTFINDWLFEGLVGAGGTLDCSGVSSGSEPGVIGNSGGGPPTPSDGVVGTPRPRPVPKTVGRGDKSAPESKKSSQGKR